MSFRTVNIFTCDGPGCSNTFEVDRKDCDFSTLWPFPGRRGKKTPYQWATDAGWLKSPEYPSLHYLYHLCHECNPGDDQEALAMWESWKKRKAAGNG
jgi:hypothetical protein